MKGSGPTRRPLIPSISLWLISSTLAGGFAPLETDQRPTLSFIPTIFFRFFARQYSLSFTFISRGHSFQVGQMKSRVKRKSVAYRKRYNERLSATFGNRQSSVCPSWNSRLRFQRVSCEINATWRQLSHLKYCASTTGSIASFYVRTSNNYNNCIVSIFLAFVYWIGK